MASKKYCEYFDVNESYFPCIDESAINAGAPWETTYPQETFIDLLNSAEKMLGGTTNRSIWIHGAYGTGKSQCAYALKKILEVPNDELRAYWDRYEPLKKNKALLEKLIGHKEQGVLTAYRYASGSITSPQLLFLAVQESIRAALDAVPGSYKGENTLKESVIAWLTDSSHNAFVNSLLQKPEWVSEFSQSSADEIINSLRKRSDVSSLMESIFKMAEKEGITALSLTADSLCAWIKDIVAQNHTKVVLIWDEFSGFFRQNRNSLDEFQKIVALCQETHFYFVIVTHPITSIAGASISKDDPMSVVQQRYKQIEITLPPNIAFELIGHAFSVIPAAKDQWEVMTGDLNSKISASKIAVMKAAVVKSDSVMQHMLPIHPMAALVLKNIASAFQSNQRSMFDFIKTPKDLDVHAFQWFIQNTRPDSDRSLLTVDMLWDFFYEKGKDYLTSDIKLILDTYPQQTNLTEKEKVVLKTILIMQAVDQRLGGTIPVLKATDQNLSYAFEGDWDVYENECKSIAKALVKKGVLIQTPIADGKQVYSAAVLAGDGAKIDRLKDEVRKNGTITKLVEEGTQLASALSLTPPLRLRYAVNTDTGALPVVTVTNFVKMMDQLKVKDTSWHFFAVLALARTDEEAQTFRNMIKKTIGNAEYKTILVIDALSSPLGLELFEEYVSYSAMSMYYNGNNNQQSKDNARKAREVLDRTWRDRIHDGSFIVWSYANQDGEKATGANAVHTIMQTVVLNPALAQYLGEYVFDCGGLSDELTKYFKQYRLMKVTNQITPEFLAQVEQNAQKLPYTHLETRDSAILRIPDKKDAFLYWIDALGVEYLSYIAILAKKKGLSIHVDIAYVELPTITSINKGFFEKWAGSKKEKEPRLDEIKHKEEGGYFYRPGQAPVHLASELEVIRKSIDRAATELAMHTCKTFVIASDHGASRLAVIHHQEEKYDTDTKGEHSGRCCKEFADADLPQAICENGYLVLADYGRFKNSRAANVEVHGGASLEEVIVPIITLSLKKQCDLIIELLNADEVYCDRRLGTTIQLYISDADNTQSISVVIDEKRYAAKGSDKTHYEVNLYDMRRAKKNVSAAIYDGDDLIGTVHFDIKGKMATVNNDFDDLF